MKRQDGIAARLIGKTYFSMSLECRDTSRTSPLNIPRFSDGEENDKLIGKIISAEPVPVLFKSNYSFPLSGVLLNVKN